MKAGAQVKYGRAIIREDICSSSAQERTYLRFYGSLGERFCCIEQAYQVSSKQ